MSRRRNDIADLRIEHLRKRHDSPVEGDAAVIIGRHINQALDTSEERIDVGLDVVQFRPDRSLIGVESNGVDLLAEFVPNLGIGSHIVTDDTLDRRIDGGESLVDLGHLGLEGGGIDLLTDQFRQLPLKELILGVDIGNRGIGLQKLADFPSLTEGLLGLAESLVSGILGLLDLDLGFGHPSLDLSDSGSDLTEIGSKGGEGILDLVDVGLENIQASLQGNGGINQLLDSGIVLERLIDPGNIGLLVELVLDPRLVSLLGLELGDSALIGRNASRQSRDVAIDGLDLTLDASNLSVDCSNGILVSLDILLKLGLGSFEIGNLALEGAHAAGEVVDQRGRGGVSVFERLDRSVDVAHLRVEVRAKARNVGRVDGDLALKAVDVFRIVLCTASVQKRGTREGTHQSYSKKFFHKEIIFKN